MSRLQAPPLMAVDSEKQLFIDEYLVDTKERITRNAHQFTRHPANPLVVPQESWERAEFMYGTAMQDQGDRGFRIWCTNVGSQPYGQADRQLRCQLWYASSKDGIVWERPSLGIVEIDGSKDNNICALNRIGKQLRAGNVIFNPQAADPAHRYIHLQQLSTGTAPSYSGDGLHWTDDEAPVLMASDAATLSHDPVQNRFFCSSVSDVKARGFFRRSIEMAETDLHTWRRNDDFKTVLVADEIDDAGAPARIARLRSILDYDNPDHYHAQLHHMVAYRSHCVTLGMVTVWDNTWSRDREPLFSGGRDRAIVHTQLTVSRDPDWLEWHRMPERKSLIEPSDPGEWDCAIRMPFYRPLEVGDELWLYYTGWARLFNAPRMYGAGVITGAKPGKTIKLDDTLIPAGEKLPANGIGLATMRLDGYISLDAGPRGGVLTTKPFTFRGSKLVLNARALGHITVEILNADGERMEECGHVSITGDSVKHCIPWQDLRSLTGKPVRLRFRMWNAQLYGFAFEE